MEGPGLFRVWPEVAHTFYNPAPSICKQGDTILHYITLKEIKKKTLQVIKNNLSCGCEAVLLLVEVTVAEGRVSH